MNGHPDPKQLLREKHYLGPHRRGTVYQDAAGVLVFRSPSSRHLPKHWLELCRWCIVSGEPNAGSMQWGRVVRWLRLTFPDVTTVVSYSDPGAGHDGALYRATNWLWAPTWHRLRPPPSGLGSWDGGKTQQTVKDRWVFPLTSDAGRAAALPVNDASLRRRFPWAEYREPTWRKGRRRGGGGDWRRFYLAGLQKAI